LNTLNDYQQNYGEGFISLHRSIKKHWIFDKDKYFKWWVLMLMEVNHSGKKFALYYEIYDVKRGQSANSLKVWAKLFNCAPKTVTRFFDLLIEDKMIVRKIIGKGLRSTTLINVEKYNQYQDVGNRKVIAKGTQSNRKVPTNNNVNNYNKVNIPKFLDFKIYALSKSDLLDKRLLKLKYESWSVNGWKDGNNKPIKNWKSKLLNTIPYLEKQKYKSDAL